ncbi:MAG TPA: hypothetical protein VFN02_11390, partial [Ktedonobacteraceae bacterium]|nr:hypothetical protein [Ktedonobacteraceae bacterium]
MKTNKNLANIISTGTALVLCFAILVFASLMLWVIATPAHVHAHTFPACQATPPFTCPTLTAAG